MYGLSRNTLIMCRRGKSSFAVVIFLLLSLIPAGVSATASDSTKDTAVLLNAKGFDLYNQARYGDALDSFEQAIAIDPFLQRAWYGKGLACAALSNHDQAVKAFDRATELNADDEDAWMKKGDSFRALGRNDLAATAYRRVVLIDPNDAEAKGKLEALGISVSPTPFVTSATSRPPGILAFPETIVPVVTGFVLFACWSGRKGRRG
jgi:tetratricopeptide (TPR) repeat protein